MIWDYKSNWIKIECWILDVGCLIIFAPSRASLEYQQHRMFGCLVLNLIWGHKSSATVTQMTGNSSPVIHPLTIKIPVTQVDWFHSLHFFLTLNTLYQYLFLPWFNQRTKILEVNQIWISVMCTQNHAFVLYNSLTVQHWTKQNQLDKSS